MQVIAFPTPSSHFVSSSVSLYLYVLLSAVSSPGRCIAVGSTMYYTLYLFLTQPPTVFSWVCGCHFFTWPKHDTTQIQPWSVTWSQCNFIFRLLAIIAIEKTKLHLTAMSGGTSNKNSSHLTHCRQTIFLAGRTLLWIWCQISCSSTKNVHTKLICWGCDW